MKKAFKLVLFIFLGLAAPSYMGCQQQPTVTANPDITGNIVGTYTGNYVVNYEAEQGPNLSFTTTQ